MAKEDGANAVIIIRQRVRELLPRTCHMYGKTFAFSRDVTQRRRSLRYRNMNTCRVITPILKTTDEPAFRLLAANVCTIDKLNCTFCTSGCTCSENAISCFSLLPLPPFPRGKRKDHGEKQAAFNFADFISLPHQTAAQESKLKIFSLLWKPVKLLFLRCFALH